MVLFNRIVVAGLALAMLALAVGLVAIPQMVLSAAEAGLAGLRAVAAEALAAGAAILAGLALAVSLLELWPRRARTFGAQVEGSTVEYPAATLTGLLGRELAGLDGVRRASVDVQGHGRKAAVSARLLPEPERDPQEVAARAARRVREKLERGMGLRLTRLHLAIEPPAPAPVAEPAGAQPATAARNSEARPAA